jgi:hypothetical protein
MRREVGKTDAKAKGEKLSWLIAAEFVEMVEGRLVQARVL